MLRLSRCMSPTEQRDEGADDGSRERTSAPPGGAHNEANPSTAPCSDNDALTSNGINAFARSWRRRWSEPVKPSSVDSGSGVGRKLVDEPGRVNRQGRDPNSLLKSSNGSRATAATSMVVRRFDRGLRAMTASTRIGNSRRLSSECPLKDRSSQFDPEHHRERPFIITTTHAS